MIDKIKKFLSSLLFIKRTRFQPHVSFKYTKRNGTIFRVAAVQIKFQTFKNVRDFYYSVLKKVKEAKEQGAQLICFPKGMNLELQPISHDIMSVSQCTHISELYSKVFTDISTNEEVYVSEAQKWRNSVVKSIWTPDGRRLTGNIMNCGGRKISFLEENYTQDDKIELVLNPSMTHFWMGDYESFRSAWLFSQQMYVYSVESYMVGNYKGTQFSGKSGIYGPIEVTNSQNGILALSKSENLEDLIVAELNFTDLERVSNLVRDKGYERLLSNDKL